MDMEEQWLIESVDSFYYRSNRFYSYTYKEVTYWFNPISFERKETERVVCIEKGQEYNLPSWCSRCEYRSRLNHD